MIEKRKLKRRHLIYYLRVFNRSNNQLLGHLVDITAEGMMLISEDPIQVNTVYELKMILPTGMGGKEEVQMDAHAVWCKRDINPNFYATGFETLQIDASCLEVIENLIDTFGFRD
jgi:hypothetical protein